MGSQIAFFSNQFASKQGHGVARYSKELFAHLRNQNECDITPIAAWSDVESTELENFKEQTGLQLLRTGRRLTSALWTYLGWPWLEIIAGRKFDLVHILSLGYPVSVKGKVLITIHDIGPLTHPEYFSENPPWLMRKALKQAVKNCQSIICVSEYTAMEVKQYALEHFAVDLSEKLVVVHEGVNQSFFDAPRKVSDAFQNKLPENFFLCAGKISPRKNTIRVFEALTNAQLQTSNLVLVGGDGWDHEQVKLKVAELNLQNRVHFLGYVSDEELKYCYTQCQAFVYPSLFEGFGLTVLEAMACGSPVISSNTTSIPEVAGDAALLVNPLNSEDIAEAMIRISQDEKSRTQLIEKGSLRAKKMTWKKAATETIKVYQEVLEKND